MMSENKPTNASPQPVTAGEQAKVNVSSDEIKPSFQHKEVGDQPCMSFMRAVPAEMCGSDTAGPRPVPPSAAYPMSQEDRDFFNAGKIKAREIAKDFLSFLVRYDSGISAEDAQALCVAINAIERAGVP